MILATAASLLLVTQQASEAVSAEYPENSETWALEYPSLIGAFVDDYYSCLKSGNYIVGDGSGFADQYRGDIQRCAKQAVKLEKGANDRLSQRGRTDEASPEQVAEIFETVRRIHVARGTDLDALIAAGLSNHRRYREEQETTVDTACVARVTELRNQREDFAATEGPKLERIHDKDEYTAEDRLALMNYSTELLRLTRMMQFEMRRCPGSEIADNTAQDQVPNS
ncbi:hypothetical protein GRI34_10655 [Erythrobacter aquimaris]|uniref:Uncharacterized protein n=1 Tax=Qipengyuania aquimaris TaxID=255984 RepID=A0A6I4TLR4_9SPHN|nr:hypothetical protein [Qipengyuania aquimaris]MXO96874.1 hypothetical protein [Qipengyuania aquimaris]